MCTFSVCVAVKRTQEQKFVWTTRLRWWGRRGERRRDGIGSGNNMSPPRSCRRVAFFSPSSPSVCEYVYDDNNICKHAYKNKSRPRAINKNVYLYNTRETSFRAHLQTNKDTARAREHQPPRGDGSGGDDDEWRTCSFVSAARKRGEYRSDEENIIYCYLLPFPSADAAHCCNFGTAVLLVRIRNALQVYIGIFIPEHYTCVCSIWRRYVHCCRARDCSCAIFFFVFSFWHSIGSR